MARRHGISDSLLYNWRSAWKAAASAVSGSERWTSFRSVSWAKQAGPGSQRWRGLAADAVGAARRERHRLSHPY